MEANSLLPENVIFCALIKATNGSLKPRSKKTFSKKAMSAQPEKLLKN
jgi:hypothetical protein